MTARGAAVAGAAAWSAGDHAVQGLLVHGQGKADNQLDMTT